MGLDARTLEEHGEGIMKKRWLVAAFLLAAAGCEKPPEVPQGNQAEKPSLAFEGFRAEGTRLGVKEWESTARTAQVFQTSKLARAQQVFVRYFQKGQEVSQVQSDSAEINLDDHDILAMGHVILRSSKGAVLYTDRLRWQNQSQVISTDAWVKVIKGDNVLTGRGLTADRELEHVEVKEQVQVRAKSLEEARETAKELSKEKNAKGK
jgi:LPS export ABC transporter protein LptC